MKKVLSTGVGVLLAVSVTLGGAATAFADSNSHASTTHGQSANHQSATNNQSSGSHGNSGGTHGNSGGTHGNSSGTHGNSGGTHGNSGGTHGNSSGTHGKSADARNNQAQHQQDVQALKTATAKLQEAIKADQSEHKLLVQTIQQFEKSLQGAIAAGNSAAVQSDIVKAKTALQAVDQAVKDQNEANKSVAGAHTDQTHGDLANAINAINNATLRIEAKTTAMQGAIIVIDSLVSTLNGNTVGNNTAGNNNTLG